MRSLVFSFLKLPRYLFTTGNTLLVAVSYLLKNPGWYSHATYSFYTRGVSVLVHKSLSFTLVDLHLEPEERFVLLHAAIGNIPMVVVGLYMSPPVSLKLLHKITQLMAIFFTDNVVLAGDFNIVPCPNLDRLTLDMAVDSLLSRWASTFDLTDVWQ